MWLLLVEDEIRLANSLKRGLEEEGYTVDLAGDGEEGVSLGLVNAYDALIVDWRLPRKDGKHVIEKLRENGKQYPIIMLTALGDIDHRVQGLDAGADDYLTKPFSFEELLARLRALLRRPPLTAQDRVLRAGLFELDSARRRVTLKDKILNLRPKEFQLLELFIRSGDSVLSRTVISERVWGDAFYVSDNSIDVTISGLRQKLTEAQEEMGIPGEQSISLETIRGVGYRLTRTD